MRVDDFRIFRTVIVINGIFFWQSLIKNGNGIERPVVAGRRSVHCAAPDRKKLYTGRFATLIFYESQFVNEDNI